MKPQILLIYTGGTIGMMKDPVTGTLQAFDFAALLDKIPELNLLDCNIDTVSFETPIDSSNINPSHWISIATLIEDNYKTHDGFVVLHGSDTMSYTASALSFMLENLSKPVIFTGSQLPIGDLRTDAKENLISEGDYVCLESPRGKVDVKARITDEVKEGILSTTFHFPEIMINNITGDVHDSEAMCPEYKVVAVRVRKSKGKFKQELV